MPVLAGFRVECETLCRQPLSRLTINVDNLSTFDELSPIVDHKVSIMREGLANLLPGSDIDNNSENLLNSFPSCSENRVASCTATLGSCWKLTLESVEL